MKRIVMHIDLNTFFVRAEEIKNPSLEGKPVGIGHLGRGGIISTCSYEARRFGVRSGMPSFQATKLCPQLILLDGDYQFYNVLSLSFYSFLKRRFKVVERASIDEFDAFYHVEIAKEIVNEFIHHRDNQIIITTHNANLMSNTLLRPDCYFIITESRHIKSLPQTTERELREGHNLSKMYLSGVFMED